jgi:trehalose 6-phosphate phosphatase
VSSVFNHLDVIKEALKRIPFGLITDVDGTISRTTPTPQESEVSPLCRHYLSDLCNHLGLVAAISGRLVTEVKNMINIDRVVCIGNHGLERWIDGHSEFTRDAQHYSRVIKAAIEELTPLLPIRGIIFEDKRVTAAIHYRLCDDPQSAERNILTAIENSPYARGLRTIRGRMVINLLPTAKVNKGTATLDLIHEYHLKGGVYLGDDFSDVDAFRAIHAARHDSDFRGFAIGVTSQEVPEKLAEEADFTLNGVDDVERFLKWLSQTVAGRS